MSSASPESAIQRNGPMARANSAIVTNLASSARSEEALGGDYLGFVLLMREM